MTRRILQVIATLDRSGAEKQLALLAAGLDRNEFDVHVCTFAGGGPYEAELRGAGIPVTTIDKQLKYDPRAWWRLRKQIARLEPDLVHTWMFTANAYGRTAARGANVKHLVASERCVDSWKAWHQLAIDRQLARHTDAVVVNSRGVQEFYRQQGIAQAKLRLIYNGIGPAPPSSVSRETLLRELGLPPDVRLVGSIGRLWHQKRFKDVIWAADLVKVVRKDVHCLILGEGPQRDDLELFRDHCQIADRVHFLGARSDVMRLLPHFDVLWLASSFEGLPNVIMEAMTAAVPVVATDIWGNRELVVHGETGFLVPVGDRAGLARFAYKILEDRALGKQLGAAGQKRILAEFTIEKMVAQHAALYRELLG